jgi:hypothetical protein
VHTGAVGRVPGGDGERGIQRGPVDPHPEQHRGDHEEPGRDGKRGEIEGAAVEEGDDDDGADVVDDR